MTAIYFCLTAVGFFMLGFYLCFVFYSYLIKLNSNIDDHEIPDKLKVPDMSTSKLTAAQACINDLISEETNSLKRWQPVKHSPSVYSNSYGHQPRGDGPGEPPKMESAIDDNVSRVVGILYPEPDCSKCEYAETCTISLCYILGDNCRLVPVEGSIKKGCKNFKRLGEI